MSDPVIRMHHAAIAAEDLDKAVVFYRDVVGLVPGPTPEAKNPLQWMYAGDVPVLHIFQPGAGRDPSVPGTYGVAHLALEIGDFEVARARLDERGIDYESNAMESRNSRQLFFDGPDGVRVELIEFGHAEKGQ